MSVAPVERRGRRGLDTSTVVSPTIRGSRIVWNDPVNLMSYVTYVFQKYFGYPKEKATS